MYKRIFYIRKETQEYVMLYHIRKFTSTYLQAIFFEVYFTYSTWT
jgi:hypothetical protein